MKFVDPQPQDDKAPKTSLGIRKKAKGTRQKITRNNLSESTQADPPKSTFQCDSASKVIHVKADRCPVPVRQGTLRSLIKKRKKGGIWLAPNDGTDLGPNDIRNSISTIDKICARR